MQAILYCDNMTECIPEHALPEALLPICNVPLLEHILRFLEQKGFRRAVLLAADEQVRQLTEMLTLQMEVQMLASPVSLRADMPTLLLRRLCLPQWDVGELLTLSRDPVRLINADGSQTYAELHPTGSPLLVPEQQITAELSVFRHPDTPAEYRSVQQTLLREGRFREQRLGRGVRLGRQVQIDELSIVGNDCVLGEGVQLERCILGDGAQIGDGAQLRDCVICRHALVDRQAVLEGAAVPQSGAVRQDAHGVRVRRCVVLPGDGICEERPRWNTAETALQAGAAVTALGSRVCVGYDSCESAAMAAAAGAASQGAHVWYAGRCSLSQQIFASRTAGCEVMLRIRGDAPAQLLPLTGDGLALGNAQNSRLQQALASRSAARIAAAGQISDAAGLSSLWEEQCRRLVPPSLPEITVSCADRTLRETAQRLLSGGSGEQITLTLSEDGTRAAFFSMEAGLVRYEQLLLLSLLSVREQGDALALPTDFHPAAESFAERMGGRVMRMRSPEQTPAAYELFRRQGICTDGLLLGLHVLRVLHLRRLKLRQAVALLPGLFTVRRTVSTTLTRQAVEKLQQRSTEPSVSIVLPPMSRLAQLRVHADSMEAAAELCGRMEKQLRRAERPLDGYGVQNRSGKPENFGETD